MLFHCFIHFPYLERMSMHLCHPFFLLYESRSSPTSRLSISPVLGRSSERRWGCGSLGTPKLDVKNGGFGRHNQNQWNWSPDRALTDNLPRVGLRIPWLKLSAPDPLKSWSMSNWFHRYGSPLNNHTHVWATATYICVCVYYVYIYICIYIYVYIYICDYVHI